MDVRKHWHSDFLKKKHTFEKRWCPFEKTEQKFEKRKKVRVF